MVLLQPRITMCFKVRAYPINQSKLSMVVEKTFGNINTLACVTTSSCLKRTVFAILGWHATGPTINDGSAEQQTTAATAAAVFGNNRTRRCRRCVRRHLVDLKVCCCDSGGGGRGVPAAMVGVESVGLFLEYSK
jgi:hypothetical protein